MKLIRHCRSCELTPILVSLVSKDSSMLDGLDNASIEMEEAKARLNEIITSNLKTIHSDESPEFSWMVDGAGLPSNASELLPKLIMLSFACRKPVCLLLSEFTNQHMLILCQYLD
ncbi:unnamed protein product [Lathyrus sativus]|nr:unnamed protein product [Lathyrus sativus]